MSSDADDELKAAILREAEDSEIGELMLEGWQLGIYEATLEDGEVAWTLSEKAMQLIRRGELEAYLRREEASKHLDPSALQQTRLGGRYE